MESSNHRRTDGPTDQPIAQLDLDFAPEKKKAFMRQWIPLMPDLGSRQL